LIEDYEQNGTKLNELEKHTNLRTSKSDVVHFRNLLNTDKENLNKSYNELKKVLEPYNISESDLQIPTIHQDLSDIQEQTIAARLDQARARDENNIMSSDDKKAVMAKINKWKDSEAKEDDLAQDIEDYFSGKTSEKVMEEGEEIIPEPFEQEQITIEQENTV
jgi:hypothetical protein